MAARTQPAIIDMSLSKQTKNALRLAGFDLANVGPDRPLPPDGLKIVAELWNNDATVTEIMQELNLSEARASGDLVYLELKGEIKGFTSCFYDGLSKGRFWMK